LEVLVRVDGVGDAEAVVGDGQDAGAANEVAEQALPDQHVEQAVRDRAGGQHRGQHEHRAVDHRSRQRADEQGDREPAAVRGEQAGQQLGHGGEERRHDRGHRELGHHDRPAADRGREQVDGAAVVDLGAEHPGADDQRGERQQHGEAEVAQHPVRPEHGLRF
jgi:hypothetical protein